MAIPPLNRENVGQALELLAARLDQIAEGPHKSTTYDLLWNGLRFPPKVVFQRRLNCNMDTPSPSPSSLEARLYYPSTSGDITTEELL